MNKEASHVSHVPKLKPERRKRIIAIVIQISRKVTRLFWGTFGNIQISTVELRQIIVLKLTREKQST